MICLKDQVNRGVFFTILSHLQNVLSDNQFRSIHGGHQLVKIKKGSVFLFLEGFLFLFVQKLFYKVYTINFQVNLLYHSQS